MTDTIPVGVAHDNDYPTLHTSITMMSGGTTRDLFVEKAEERAGFHTKGI